MADVVAGQTEVRGMKESAKQAAEGMKLFEKDRAVVEVDLEGATKFKAEVEAKIVALEAEAAALTGKDNKKARTEKEKTKSALKNQHDYIDACKVVKGLPSVHGHFSKTIKPETVEEVKPAETTEAVGAKKSDTDREKKKREGKKLDAGLSRAEKDELEGLKQKIITRKSELKEEGMTGGQINKHGDIVNMVARLTELKEKENPGSATEGKDEKKKDDKKKKKLDSAASKVLEAKQKEFDEYCNQLKNEFKYSKKEISADPDYQAMKKELDALSK